MPRSDYDDAIHRQPAKEKVAKQTRQTKFAATGVLPEDEKGEPVCFDLNGEWTEDRNKAACKIIYTDGIAVHYVKFATEGPDRGHMLNPYSIYYREGDDTRIEARRGTMRYEFRKVNKEAFDLYVISLKKKIPGYRIEAERKATNV